jgi:hypothetical protein
MVENKPDKLKPSLYGGIIIGLISGIPFLNLINCFCCAGVLLGGFLSVFFYKNELAPGGPLLMTGDAIQLGALAGVFGAVIGTILTAVLFFTVGNVAGEAMYNLIVSIYDSVGIIDQMPPGTLEQMREGILEGSLSPFSIVMGLVIDALFGLLGGLIGYSVFRQKGQVQVPPPPPMNPPAQM